MSTVSPDSVAQDQIRAFVERILRLKEEVKATQGDIREVYAEAKGNGFDKTTLGKLVNYVEKRASDANALAEQDALFDLYLDAYDSASGPHAHAPARAHVEIIDEFRAGKSGKKEPQASRPAQAGGTETLADQSTAPGTDRGDNSTDGGSPAEPIDPAAAKTLPAGTQAPPVDTHPLSSAAPLQQTEDRSVEAALHGSAPVTSSYIADGVSSPLAQGDACTSFAGTEGEADWHLISEPVTAPPPAAVTVVAGRESAMDPSALPAARLDRSKPHPDCQDPSDCGLASWTHMCGGCMRARAATASGVALQ